MLSTTSRISGLSLAGNGWSKNFAYTYDANGNISSITENGETVGSYLYDSQNQLAIATHNGKIYSCMYDKGGNIQVKSVDGTSVTYTYGDSTWKDLLTAYNGNPITYDTIGNPLTYYDGKTFDWDGRQLKSVGTGTTYKYNADGIRTEKTTSGMTTRFYLNGSQIIASQNNYGFTYYDYDATGKVISTVYLGNTYYYVYNLQGDVVGITNSAGELVVEYTYDPWGKVIGLSGSEMSGIGLNNPFRYRGYYYDTETGFYYVSSRYYDPEIGRWINADSVIAGLGGSIQGYNMFAYCFNNPVNMSDSSGHWPQWMKDAENWVNNNIIQPVANFFSPSTNTISGQFQDGVFRGSGSLTGGYSEFNWRLDDKIKSSGSQDGWVGGFVKASVGNANGKIGIGNDNLSASLKGVADGLVATAQAGLHYKDGFGVGAKAKASVLSGRATTEFNIFGWQVELGVSGDVLSVGAEATIGIFPTDDGGKQFDARCNAGAGWFGWGYVVRVKAPA